MIVVDENIEYEEVIGGIAAWYPGRVMSITGLRIDTLVKDDNVTTLLLRVPASTFVTLNVDDFWRKLDSHEKFCIVGIVYPQPQMNAVPTILRRLLRLPEFRTKASRMGKIIRVRPTAVDYYERDRRVHTLPWDRK